MWVVLYKDELGTGRRFFDSEQEAKNELTRVKGTGVYEDTRVFSICDYLTLLFIQFINNDAKFLSENNDYYLISTHADFLKNLKDEIGEVIDHMRAFLKKKNKNIED